LRQINFSMNISLGSEKHHSTSQAVTEV